MKWLRKSGNMQSVHSDTEQDGGYQQRHQCYRKTTYQMSRWQIFPEVPGKPHISEQYNRRKGPVNIKDHI